MHSSSETPNPQKFLLLEDTQAAAARVIEVIEKLCAYYDRETEILLRTETKNFIDIQSEKSALALEYQSYVGQMRARKQEMKSLPEETKQKIESLHATFIVACEANKHALMRIQNGTKRLHNRMFEQIKKAAQRYHIKNYTDSGALADNAKRLVSAGMKETA